jgi:hypothetical protein
MSSQVTFTVSNRFKFPGGLRVQLHPKLDHGNGSYHTKNLDRWTWASVSTTKVAFHVHNPGSNRVCEL